MFSETPIDGMTLRGRSEGVWDGLVGGHLPVLVFLYPDLASAHDIVQRGPVAAGSEEGKSLVTAEAAAGCAQGTGMAGDDIPCDLPILVY